MNLFAFIGSRKEAEAKQAIEEWVAERQSWVADRGKEVVEAHVDVYLAEVPADAELEGFGLHFDDIRRLLAVLQRLVDLTLSGNRVLDGDHTGAAVGRVPRMAWRFRIEHHPSGCGWCHDSKIQFCVTLA